MTYVIVNNETLIVFNTNAELIALPVGGKHKHHECLSSKNDFQTVIGEETYQAISAKNFPRKPTMNIKNR